MRDGTWVNWDEEWENETGEGLFPRREQPYGTHLGWDSDNSDFDYRYLQSDAKYVRQSYILDENDQLQKIFTVSTSSKRGTSALTECKQD